MSTLMPCMNRPPEHLQGLSKSVHVLQRGVEVNDVVNMAVIAVLDTQDAVAK